MPRKTADREIAAQAAPKRRRVAGEEKKAPWNPNQFYREAEEAKEPEDDAIIRHRKAKERFEKREREAKERAAAEKKKAKAAEAAARETVDADELRRLEMEQREAKERAAAEKKKAAKLAYKAAEQASWMTQIEIDLAR
jgi:colicin import membrane protein